MREIATTNELNMNANATQPNQQDMCSENDNELAEENIRPQSEYTSSVPINTLITIPSTIAMHENDIYETSIQEDVRSLNTDVAE